MEPGVDGARKQIAEVVAERIERLILDGVLKAGQALPSERRLTEKLGVSRTALREGLRVLRARQIIHTAQGKGSYVAQISQVDAGPLVHLFNSQPRVVRPAGGARAARKRIGPAGGDPRHGRRLHHDPPPL